VDARRLIRERIQEAVVKAGEIKPLALDGPVVVEIEREEPWPQAINEGAERVDAHTLRYHGENIWQTLHTAFYGRRDYPLPE
jgi:D-aminopeptidase